MHTLSTFHLKKLTQLYYSLIIKILAGKLMSVSYKRIILSTIRIVLMSKMVLLIQHKYHQISQIVQTIRIKHLLPSLLFSLKKYKRSSAKILQSSKKRQQKHRVTRKNIKPLMRYLIMKYQKAIILPISMAMTSLGRLETNPLADLATQFRLLRQSNHV